MLFRFERVRFQLAAQRALHFPGPLPGNLLRGALGTVLMARPADYARIFAPESERGPSGLAQRPRPFVLRAAHLTEVTLEPGQEFYFDVHVFQTDVVEALVDAFSQVMREGLGAARTPVRLLGMDRAQMEIALEPALKATQVVVEFATPTELKHDGKPVAVPEFPILFGLIRMRLLNLSGVPVGAMATAPSVQMVDSDLRHIEATRFSTRTRQRHPIGGFVGTATYAGDMTPFLPYLRAAQYTGVGRQTTWGKGELRIRL